MNRRSMFAGYLGRVVSYALAIGVAAAGCAGSETGNPTASLTLGLRATDPTIATVGVPGDAIRVQELWLSIDRIAAVGCAADAPEVAITHGAISGDLAEGLDVGELPVGEYCGLHLQLQPSALSTLPVAAAPGPATIAAYGTRADGLPFAVLSGAPLDLAIPGAVFTVSEGHSLLLAFDVSAWLRDAVLDSATVVDGIAVLDGREHPAVTSTFETQLTASLHDDLNADGHVDADEAALALIH
jgi:hypothetical protein